MMKALVFKGTGKLELQHRPRPAVSAPTDAVVRITKTTICGTDLHIRKGDVATCEPGRILGHEGVGVVEEVGGAVDRVRRGDRVLISCISSCARCEYCRRGMYSHCEAGGGWVLGNTIDGTQAEYVRVPHADSSLYTLPAADAGAGAVVDDAAIVLLSDIFPTAFECGVLNGRVQPGCTVAIVGAGPVGLAAVVTAQMYSPSTIVVIDTDANRLKVALSLGATHAVDPAAEDAVEAVKAVTEGKGCDTVIEAVGIPQTFVLCQKLLAPGGVLANVGVHGAKADFLLEDLWAKNICTSLVQRQLANFCRPRCLLTTSHSCDYKIGRHRVDTDASEASFVWQASAIEANHS